MNEIFTFVENNTYNLRSGMHRSRVNVHSTQHGKESVGNLGAKIWNLVPVHMKDLKALSTFKNQKKKCIPKDCLYHLCRVYVAQVPLVETNIANFIHSVFVSFYFIYFFICFIFLFMLFMYFFIFIYFFINLLSIYFLFLIYKICYNNNC